MWLKWVTSRSAARAVCIGLAWFAFAWAVARACVQAVTGDEAQDYLLFAGRPNASHWDASANNHMLNSLLARMFTSILGLSAFSVRIPTLIGAAIYIYAIYRLCQAISLEWKIRIPLFTCLVYNPFIFDFFVAGRGYGIANAFLIGAIAVSAYWHLRRPDERELIAATAISSAFVGLAFSANFSLAFPGFTAMLFILVWAMKAVPARRWRLLAAGVIPAFLVVLFIPSWTLLNFHEQIVAGVKSLWETLQSLVHASTYQPSAYLINPLLMPVFQILRDWILPVTGALALGQFVFIVRDRAWRRNPHTAWLGALGTLISGVVILTVLEHRLAYRLFHLLMPVSRTGLYFLPLVTLMVGIAAAIPAVSSGGAVFRKALIGALCVLSVYYLFCMRLMYFEEWDYQADLNRGYQVAACYNHERNVQDVEAGWEYHAGMNFLRAESGHETFGPFSTAIPHTAGHQMYILEGNLDRDFINSEGLKVVFKSETTGMVVAARPDLADGPGDGCYVWPASP
ncbi:MAG TPA: hypothetical protein VGG72_22875 [Bryobacteraceae bacterium]